MELCISDAPLAAKAHHPICTTRAKPRLSRTLPHRSLPNCPQWFGCRVVESSHPCVSTSTASTAHGRCSGGDGDTSRVLDEYGDKCSGGAVYEIQSCVPYLT